MVANKIINQINNHYTDIVVDKYVIMPDHIHIILFVLNDTEGASRTSPPTVKQHSRVSWVVSTFKRFCNKEYGKNIWQVSFFDHIIRDKDDYNTRVKYIHENPVKWYYNNT